MDGVLKMLVALSRAEPPEAAAYQSMISPAPGVAEMLTTPVPQRVPATPRGAAGLLRIVTDLVAVPFAHPPVPVTV